MPEKDNGRTVQKKNSEPTRMNEVEMQQIMSKFDRESAYRVFKGKFSLILGLLLACFSLLQLYSTWRIIPSTHMRPIHIGIVTTFAYVLYPMTKKGRKDKLPWWDAVLAILALATFLYPVIHFDQVVMHTGNITLIQQIIALTAIILLLEACRRVVGLPIIIIALTFIAIGFFGRSMPSFLSNRGYSAKRILEHLFYTSEGIMGAPIGASSTFIFLFILFGSFLEMTGVGQFFIDLSNAIAGHKRGGPAKVAVITSALEGTVSGSSVANTVGSGSFTIPMMKKLGYRPEFAAAVEAAASTGGQIMPPVMGAAAFLMCDSVGVPYSVIVKAAIIPALLYFMGIWIITDLEAKKQGLRGMKKSEMPKLKSVLLDRGYLMLPLIAIIYVLAAGFTPSYAALIGILCAILGSYMKTLAHVVLIATRGVKIEYLDMPAADVKKLSRGKAIIECLRHTTGLKLSDYFSALASGARSILAVALACGVAGMIAGMITLTGVGTRLGNSLTQIAGNSTMLLLIFTMLTSIILGMGVPTTANYLITSTMMAGVIAKALNPGQIITTDMLLPAHMFTFYFGIVADITPPVALAAMAGAAIAKSKPLRTGVEATRIAIAAFLVPFIFILNPKMLMINAEWYEVAWIAFSSIIGMIGIGAAVEKYWRTSLSILEMLCALTGGLMLIVPDIWTDIAGFLLIFVVYLIQTLKVKKYERSSLAVALLTLGSLLAAAGIAALNYTLEADAAMTLYTIWVKYRVALMAAGGALVAAGAVITYLKARGGKNENQNKAA